ncbi:MULTISPECIES: DUF2017 family protein [unclassified Leucobacter]|uniref:DUF2017 family protein n=1 Tax=unclassified Leucobacter TaxID=2621730 RepID=UPI00165E331F|nr:DUF2017 family protein [Leucobacter sp. CX169]MBC9928067.1 DUF2017 family protein [Leucobacter sp. cx-169]
MRIVAGRAGALTLELFDEEATLLENLLDQLIELLQSHSGTSLDPDPLFASLEIGGTDETPEDPALARLFPDAYSDAEEAAKFRRVTEQGLLNRKLQDATSVVTALAIDAPDRAGVDAAAHEPVRVTITAESLPEWVRTVSALRLAIAARLGIDGEEDHERALEDDETHGTVLVFDWLAAIVDSLLRFESVLGDEPIE